MKKNTLLYIVAVLAVLGIVYSIFSFGTAFPIVNVKITADKEQILNSVDSLNKVFKLMDEDSKTVAVFDTDTRFKNYVELEGGGVEVFQKIVNSEIYHPYTWQVRQFNPNEIKECHYIFTPKGKFLGFQLTVPDTLPGADYADIDITDYSRNALSLALLADLDKYELFESSSEVKESGRRDHLLTYKLIGEEIGEANYRLKVKVSGDHLTMIMPGVKIPETFDHKYEEMRSANTTIAYVGQAIMLILYGILGVALALFFMIRKRTLVWKPALKWSVVIGVLIFMAYLTTIALSWYNYDTSLSSGQFIFQQVLSALLNGLLISLIFFASSTAGEGLGRQAFPEHIQFWKSWGRGVGASKEIMRHTSFGYLWAFFMIGFVTFFYWLTNHVFHWWSPADNMMDPNILAIPFPWLLPSAQSLQAGFWEETLFRAVPLAGAVLIGKNFKKKGLWIGIALVLQAMIFGAMHANYPQQPAYARIIEMLIPFVLYGLIYMNWGLLPVVVSHFVYDIVLMAMPLFLLSAPGIWVNRVLAIIFMLIPLLIVIFRRLQAGAWYYIQAEDLNSGFVVPKVEQKEEKIIAPAKKSTHRELPILLAVVFLVVGALGWYFLTPKEQNIPRLEIEKKEAIAIADEFIALHLSGTDSLELKPFVVLNAGTGRSSQFVWEHSSPDTFNLLYENELAANYYSITYKTFKGDVVRRSEIIKINIARDGDIMSWYHHVPQPRPGAELDENKALELAESTIREFCDIDMSGLELVKTTPEKLKARTDWSIIYRDLNSGLKEGDIRYEVSLAGDEINGVKSYVHSTEKWDREQKKAGVLKAVLQAISIVIRVGMLITVLVFAIIAWTKKDFNVKIFVWFLIGFIAISLIQGFLMSKMIIAQYPTSEPYSNLMLMLFISVIIGAIFSGFLYSLPLGYIARIPLHVQRNEPVIGVKGASLGFVLAAAISFAQGSFLAKGPVSIDPLQLDATFPILFSGLGAIESYFVKFITLMLPFVIAERISKGWQKGKVWTLIILFFSGFSLVGKLPLEWWLLGGAVCGAVMILLYVFVLRFNMIYIPVMAGTIILLDLLQYLFVNPAALTITHVIVVGLISIGLTALTVYGMYMLRILQPKKTAEN